MTHFCRNFVRFLFLVLLTASTPQTWAALNLNFPAEKNNVLILPQKFEYSLRDATKLLLGNRVIDTSQFQFLMFPNQQSVEVQIQWPHNVIESGRVVILNPSGVSIWTQKFSDSISTYTIANATSLVQKLSTLSFFKFCAGYYEIETGLDVCSPELIIKGSGKNLTVALRPYNKKANVQINGRAVTPHGIVFLNDERESLSFRATSASGAEFKMDTRRIKLNFVDVLSVDDKNFMVTAEGPYPLTPSQIKKISPTRWSALLRKERPIVYVVGEGRVPLRQELVVQGTLPTESHRLYLEHNSPRKTYSSQVTLRGHVAERGSPRSADENSEVSVAGQQFSWTLKSVPRGKERVSYLQTQDQGEIFTAAYNISRQDSARLELLLGLNSDEARFYFGSEAQIWIEKTPVFERSLTQRLGLGLIYNQDISGDAKVILTELDLLYRLWPGLQFWEPSPIFGVALQNWSFDSKSLQATSLVMGWHGVTPLWMNQRWKDLDWQESDIKFTLPSKTSSLNLKQTIQLRWKVYQRLQNESKLRYSAGFYTQSIETTKKLENSGILLETAWVTTF